MKRHLLALFLICGIARIGQAQQLPLYTQYAFNPYMVNPSFVAVNQSEVNLLYRQQWTAITNGPKTLQFDGQYRLNDKMGLGFQLVNDKAVMLNATSVMVTYGYRVQLATDHTLGFGLSAGIFANRLDLSEVPPADLNDPALLSARTNNMAVDGQFGFHYRFKGLIVGASLVNLFDRKTFTAESFQKTKLSQLKNNIILAGYRFTVVPETWFIQPNFAYRLATANANYYEASAVVSYRNLVEVGGGYRQDFGPTSMLRVNLGNFQAGFAYDFPSPTAQVSTGGTREIQLKWRFGKPAEEVVSAKKKRKSDQPVVLENTTPVQEPKENTGQKDEVVDTKIDTVPEEVVTKNEPVKEEPKLEPVKEEPVKKEEPVIEQPVKKEEPVKQQPVKKEPVIEQKQPELHPEVPADEYHLIAGSFKDRENASRLLKTLAKKGYKAEIIESTTSSEGTKYYVRLVDFTEKEISVDKILEIQKKTGIHDAWFRKRKN